ncbi:MAG: FHA domain-containing protein [Magnetococcales bacterium]|nr:FHA domain-containing protein [Magnetococcales bacterium]
MANIRVDSVEEAILGDGKVSFKVLETSAKKLKKHAFMEYMDKYCLFGIRLEDGVNLEQTDMAELSAALSPELRKVENTLIFPLIKRLKPSSTRSAEEFIIGSSPHVDCSIDDESLSKQHAKLFFSRGRHFIKDLGSQSGTVLNGKAFGSEITDLHEGDTILVGSYIFSLLSPGALYETLIDTRQEAPATQTDDAPETEQESSATIHPMQEPQRPVWIKGRARRCRVCFSRPTVSAPR